jgi:hypothetical protein
LPDSPLVQPRSKVGPRHGRSAISGLKLSFAPNTNHLVCVVLAPRVFRVAFKRASQLLGRHSFSSFRIRKIGRSACVPISAIPRHTQHGRIIECAKIHTYRHGGDDSYEQDRIMPLLYRVVRLSEERRLGDHQVRKAVRQTERSPPTSIQSNGPKRGARCHLNC